jgi:UDP-N-acetylmuramoyl-L-alanyl-D-glutamate--2,6-diaminopimelate ligase
MAVKLEKIFKDIQIKSITGIKDISVKDIIIDSRFVSENSLFIAIKGTITDGHNYIQNSIEKGATVIVCEQLPAEINKNITYIQVKDSTFSTGLIASNFFDNPSEKLKLIGITGTNGKTTTATLLFNLVKSAGLRAGLISTVKNYINDEEIDSTHTTPDAISINKLLSKMVENNCDYCFMEVSSHAIVQNRITGLFFSGGVFTNITHDHLDYHKTFDNYIKAKKQFFDNLSENSFSLINSDDKNGRIMLQNTKSKTYTYSLHSVTDFKCKIVESNFDGMLLNIDGTELWTKLIGKFNAYNILAVYSTSELLGLPKEKTLVILSNLNSVTGRFQYVKSGNGVVAIIDYAHTPDALLNVLNTINEIKPHTCKLITVVGAGGNRDKSKRPVMAKIANELSDQVILTSDNPRFEKPEDILSDMKKGISLGSDNKLLTIIDRKEAIKTACLFARKGDIILIAGKGHENYQEINGIKQHFDDREIVQEIFKKNN